VTLKKPTKYQGMFRHTQSADIQQNHNMGKSNQITRKIDPV